MNRFFTIVLAALMAILAAEAALAQARLPAYVPDVGGPVMAPKTPKTPKTPNVLLIPPSVALKQAMGVVPGAQALSVRPKGNVYIVKLKKGGNIIKLNVNSATGAVTRLP